MRGRQAVRVKRLIHTWRHVREPPSLKIRYSWGLLQYFWPCCQCMVSNIKRSYGQVNRLIRPKRHQLRATPSEVRKIFLFHVRGSQVGVSKLDSESSRVRSRRQSRVRDRGVRGTVRVGTPQRNFPRLRRVHPNSRQLEPSNQIAANVASPQFTWTQDTSGPPRLQKSGRRSCVHQLTLRCS
jgi:hypothetical protein